MKIDTSKLPKVENMVSSRGNEVPNQFVISNAVIKISGKYVKGTLFQSYSSLIAFMYGYGEIIVDKNRWNYSTTTSKYRNQFLRMDTKETKRLIQIGKIKLADLNG